MLEGVLIVVAVGALVIAGLTLKVRAHGRALHAAADNLERQEALAQLGMLMAGIAHELNTPMSAVHCNVATRRGAVDKLREEVAALRGELGADHPRVARMERALEAFAATDPVLEVAMNRTAELVHHMKLMGRGGRPHEAVDLNEVVDGALLLLRNTLKQGVEVTVERGDDVRVRGSAAPLGSVVINLLTNAHHAMDGAGSLRVATRREGDRVRLTVADSGPGVPPADHERIFAPGYTTKDAEEGTGLGLFISRKVAANHGGTLTVADAPGGGAAFTLDLPAPAAGDGAA